MWILGICVLGLATCAFAGTTDVDPGVEQAAPLVSTVSSYLLPSL
jgi:hypothetical protein